MKIFYDDDADLDIIKNLKVSVIGYGSQGHAHSNNLHDSGVDVTVGLRKDSSSWTKANDAGLKVAEVEDAVSGADLVMILAPDEFQQDLFETKIKPNAIHQFKCSIKIKVSVSKLDQKNAKIVAAG